MPFARAMIHRIKAYGTTAVRAVTTKYEHAIDTY